MGIKINEVIEDDLKHCSLNGVNYSEYIKENYISKADIQKALKEGSKDISENVLAIIREEYISKADYENRLKADMMAMLGELQDELKEEKRMYDYTHFIIHPELENPKGMFEHSMDISIDYIQQKINALRGGEDKNDK